MFCKKKKRSTKRIHKTYEINITSSDGNGNIDVITGTHSPKLFKWVNSDGNECMEWRSAGPNSFTPYTNNPFCFEFDDKILALPAGLVLKVEAKVIKEEELENIHWY